MKVLIFVVMASLLPVALVACAPPGEDGRESDAPSQVEAMSPQDAEALAESLGITNPPDVTPVRNISLFDWASTQIECLQEEGVDARLSEDGEGISWPKVDPQAQENVNTVRYVCELRYPVDSKYYEPLSQSQLHRLYAYRSGELVECLAAHGREVTGIPSEASFVESGGMWSPFESFSMDDTDVAALNRDCPQIPKDLYG